MKRIVLGLVAMMVGGTAFAQDYTTVEGRLVDIQVISDRQGPLPIFDHNGSYYIPGDKGERYTLYIQNNTNRRVLAVVSIDGLNVLSGEEASVRQQGYVLDAGQSTRVDGWRKSNTEVARFYFSPPSYSYAARTNQSTNIGVIGVAVFNEIGNFRSTQTPQTMRQSRMMQPQAESDQASLGTGHGERQYSYVQETYFQRSTDPSELFTIRYDTWNALYNQGVVDRPAAQQWEGQRNPFPRNHYVPDPPQWRQP